MEDNVALGIRIAVTVVLVASLVAIVLTLMVIGQSIMGSGQNKLQSALSQIQQQDLMQYSNITKKGSIVKSTIALYEGEPLAILVKTSALFTGADGDNNTTQGAVPTSGKGKYFNYGCLIEGAESDTFADTSKHFILPDGKLVAKDGMSHLEGTLDINNGIKNTNYDTKGISEIGNPEGILDNGVFYSQLVKDITGQIIGIVFTQQK